MEKQIIVNNIYDIVKARFYDCTDNGLIAVICATIYYSIIESGDIEDYLDDYLIYDDDKWEMLKHYTIPTEIDYDYCYNSLIIDMNKIREQVEEA